MPIGKTHELMIERDWRGVPAPASEHARVFFTLERSRLRIEIDAPFHDDPAPPGPAGSFDGLWHYEVVELFLLGVDERYLEIELSPHGHHLVLALHGRRRITSTIQDVAYAAHLQDGHWRGEAELALAHLPPSLRARNAYAMHGIGAARRYLAADPVPGATPDFHRLEAFAPFAP